MSELWRPRKRRVSWGCHLGLLNPMPKAVDRMSLETCLGLSLLGLYRPVSCCIWVWPERRWHQSGLRLLESQWHGARLKRWQVHGWRGIERRWVENRACHRRYAESHGLVDVLWWPHR